MRWNTRDDELHLQLCSECFCFMLCQNVKNETQADTTYNYMDYLKYPEMVHSLHFNISHCERGILCAFLQLLFLRVRIQMQERFEYKKSVLSMCEYMRFLGCTQEKNGLFSALFAC